MTSLRERLAAKAVRRSSFHVPLGDDPSVSLEALQQAEVALALVKDDDKRGRTAAAKKRDKLRAEYNEQFAEVWIKAMPRSDYHALCEQFETEDGVDWDQLLPAILAESCEDEDLRDAEFWREQFRAWPQGDFLAIQATVLNLNMQTPRPLLGKD